MEKETIIYESLIGKIYELRGNRVMLDSDLAALYGVQTKTLNQAVARNIDRFPTDFAFRLTGQEYASLKSQFVTSSFGSHGGTRKLPFVFTEHGILMLSGILRSDQAIRVNIQIMRAFITLRKTLLSYKELREKIEDMETKYDHNFQIVFQTIQRMLYEDEENNQRKIGFKTN